MDIKGGGHKSTELFLFLDRLHIMMKRLDVMQRNDGGVNSGSRVKLSGETWRC